MIKKSIAQKSLGLALLVSLIAPLAACNQGTETPAPETTTPTEAPAPATTTTPEAPAPEATETPEGEETPDGGN